MSSGPSDYTDARPGPSVPTVVRPNVMVRPDTIELNKLVNKPAVFDGSTPFPREWLDGYLRSIEDNQWNDPTVSTYDY